MFLEVEEVPELQLEPEVVLFLLPEHEVRPGWGRGWQLLSGELPPVLLINSDRLTGMYSSCFLEGEEGRQWKEGRGCRVSRCGESPGSR